MKNEKSPRRRKVAPIRKKSRVGSSLKNKSHRKGRKTSSKHVDKVLPVKGDPPQDRAKVKKIKNAKIRSLSEKLQPTLEGVPKPLKKRSPVRKKSKTLEVDIRRMQKEDDKYQKLLEKKTDLDAERKLRRGSKTGRFHGIFEKKD